MDSVVFKVKYGDMLRRFNVAVNGSQHLELSMEGLKLKIHSLFNLPPDADFRLTYNDEDDDMVTLVEDEDLHDVVRQGLDPVRITVLLNSDKNAIVDNGASGSSTPSLASSQNVQRNTSPDVTEALKSVQQPLKQLLQRSTNPDVAEIMKAVQEPLTHALSKLSLEVSSKAASASPVLADLFDGLSKLGQSYLNASQSQSVAVNLSNHEEVGNSFIPNSEGRSVEASVVEGVKSDDVVRARPEPAHKSTQATEGAVPVRPLRSSFSYDKSKNKRPGLNGVTKLEDEIARHSAVKESTKDTSQESRGSQFGENLFRSFREPIPAAECPFSGTRLSGYGQGTSSDQVFKRCPSSSRSCSKAEGLGSIFHKGVRCDGCGVLPITGPRFKSIVKYDYDLCSICFSRMGNVADYTRIDFPFPYRHSFKAPDLNNLKWGRFPEKIHGDLTPATQIHRLPVMNGPYMARPHGAKHHRFRLDSRFIMDINVIDGTTMPPSTPFTKIWRMRNNGTLPWGSGMKLLWIGGDRFSPSDSVEIEVPVNGVPVGNELDVAVDFIAPELPGRYISYWRMAEPSGHKFGQRVWVLVQVDASMDLMCGNTPVLNLNLPPDNDDQVADSNAEFEYFLEADDATAPSSEKNHENEMGDVNFPTNDDLIIPSDVVCPSPVAAASPSAPTATYPDIPASAVGTSVSYPVIDDKFYCEPTASVPVAAAAAAAAASLPFVNMLGESLGSSNTKDDETNPDSNCNAEQASEKVGVEDNLLKELEQMGFRQIDLNKKVLRMNEYDLEQSVDELCGVSEWDPILEELKEMGFEDKETNKKLLAKNNGSITRVVMDLIADEEA